ncbi:MAG TPA: GreA/GreB family elongation factor [Thermomicrobiales bacterium]|nr:GreA/GreB family elongation factor [Thermomicrobiales bacterium]
MAAGAELQLTAAGMAWLQQEVQRLRDERVPELFNALKESEGGGDIVDNSDWESTEDELVRAQQELAKLEAALAQATILPPRHGDQTIDIGSRVTVKAVDGEQLSWLLVNSLELPVSDDRVSIDSPVGLALRGKRAGDSATVQTPDGDDTYDIVAVD